jgi:hypothetical protein
MKQKILEKFDEIFSDINNLNAEKLEMLVHESLKFFDDLKIAMESPNEEEKQEAIKIATELQKKLEEQAERAFKASGMTKEQIASFTSDPSNFSKEEWDSFKKAKTELFDFQKDVLKNVDLHPGTKRENIHQKKPIPKSDKKIPLKG